MTKRDLIVQAAIDRCPVDAYIGTPPASKVTCGYIMGATGWVCTQARLDAQAKQYAAYADKIRKYGPQWLGKKCYDCAQLVRVCAAAAGYKLVSGASSQRKQDIWEAQGTIDTLPTNSKGLVLHRVVNGVTEHTAICLGDGTEAEALGHQYGVVRRSMIGRSFTHWAKFRGLDEEEETTMPDIPTTPVDRTHDTIRKDAKGPTVAEMQGRLIRYGIIVNGNQIKADGIFGPITETALKTFQGLNALTVDGVCGPATWALLLKDPDVTPPADDVYTVTVPGLTLAQADAMLAAHPGATKAVG